MTANDLFVINSLVLYLSALSLFAYYAAQNSQPTRRPEEVRDVEAH